MDRNETIKEIKAALKRRSKLRWSVTGGRGTAWGWLHINAAPARQDKNPDGSPSGSMNAEDRAALAKLLGLPDVHHQGVSIASDSAYYQEYIDRANGRKPTVIGKPYWE